MRRLLAVLRAQCERCRTAQTWGEHCGHCSCCMTDENR